MSLPAPKIDHCAPERAGAAKACPDCGGFGQAVAAATMTSLLLPQHLPAHPEGFYFCRTRHCDTAYFQPQGQSIAHRALTVRVGCKQQAAPMLVCYCFDMTHAKITEQFAGVTRASERIAGWMGTNACDCLHKNPSGRCCLGEVRALEKRLLEQQQRE